MNFSDMRVNVGQIEDQEVIYIPEKDILFCKNTAVPYKAIRPLLKSSSCREELAEKNLIITKNGSNVSLGCLNTTMSNIWAIDKNIKNIKSSWKIEN